MTTITLNAYRLETANSDDDSGFVGFEQVTVEFVLAGVQTGFSYEYDVEGDVSFGVSVYGPDGLPQPNYEIRVNGVRGSLPDFFSDASRINWGDGKSTDVYTFGFDFGDEYPFENSVFLLQLGGDVIDLNSFADLEDWLDSTEKDGDGQTVASDIPDGDFAPNTPIYFDDLIDYVRFSERDVVDAEGSPFSEFDLGPDSDLFFGFEGDDVISDGDGSDDIYGGSGNDVLIAGTGTDYFDGGEGVDTVIVDVSELEPRLYTAFFDMVTGDHGAVETTFNRDEYVNVENYVLVGNWNTEVTGTNAANIIVTDEGDDRIAAGRGNDVISTGAGNDYVRVGGGVETFIGGSGTDYISYYDSTGGVTLDLAANTASGSWASNDVVEDFEGVSGSKTGGDNITGTSGANRIKTYGGDDRVEAGKGSDYVDLGSGNDYVRAGGGQETFIGGSGTDYISYYDSSNGVRIDLRDDEVSGSWAVNDSIEDFEGASGSKTGDDVMLGTNGSNSLRGFGGDDKLYGRGGGDKLYGGSGEDFLDGGGGSGTDSLYGGSGADVFEFDRGDGTDIIKDFENDIDQINLDNFSFTTSEAYAFADEVGADVVFDFGDDGMLTIENTTIALLQNDLDVV